MNLIERVKKIIINPKAEWGVIDSETTETPALISSYLIPLALIPTLASFIGFGLIGVGAFGIRVASISIGIRYAVINLATAIIGALIAAFVINALSSSFASRNDFKKALQLVVYSYTPSMVAGIFLIIPSLGIIATLAGIYSLYILYIGIKPMMQTPDDKVTGYFIVSLLVMIVAFFVLAAIFSAIFIGSTMIKPY